MHFIVTVKTINGDFLHQFPLLKIAILFLFFPLLYLSGYLLVFQKMSRCGSWRIHVLIFPLNFISPTQSVASPFHIEQNFWMAGSRIGGLPDRWVQHYVSIVSSPTNNTRTSAIYKLADKFPFTSFLALFLDQ